MHLLTKLIIAIMLPPCFAGAQVPPAYHATRLGAGYARAINNNGQVAGLDQYQRPAVWNRSGVASILPGQVYLPFPSDINNDGTVIGQGVFTDPDDGSYYQPLIWRSGAGVERIDLPGLGGVPHSINQRGDIVGWVVRSEQGADVLGGFLKRESGTVYFDGFFPEAINGNGEIVGRGAHGLAVWRDGKLRDVPQACCGHESASNNHGWIAASEYLDDVYAGLWRDGQYTRMWQGHARGLNDAGMVVGEGDAADAVLWYEGEAHRLDDLWHEAQWAGWSLVSAVAINDHGEIAAQAMHAASGESAILLLSPVPEPAFATLLVAGLVLLGGLHGAIARKAIASTRTI
ncbi:hypothetical protein ACN9MZ_27905 [Pseudoduganella sp. S-14]|uniref:hypothetical protein n=1 Tax=Pseudoduganella sp. S-14 TaxID=3404065 RepID=UPI003CE6A7C3